MYPFPPPEPLALSPWAIALHLLLLALALSASFGLFRKSSQTTPRSRWSLWVVVVGFVTVAAALGMMVPEFRAHLIAYITFVWVLAAVACFVSLQAQASGRRPSATLVLGSILAMGVVIALLLPAVPTARQARERTECSNQMRKIGDALFDWHDRHGRFPDSASGEPPVSWRVSLLPFLGQPEVHSRYSVTHSWDSPRNLAVAQTDPDIYRCPSNFEPADVQGRYYTAYAFLVSEQTAHPSSRGLSLEEITDGQASTALVAEVCGQELVWTDPHDTNVTQRPLGINLPGAHPGTSSGAFSSYHPPGGTHLLFADGTVRFISETVDREVLRALTTATAADSVEGRDAD